VSEDVTRTVVRRHLAAWQRGDVPTLLADYTDDIVMMSAAAGALVGKDAIAAMYGQVFEHMFRPDDTKLTVTAEIYSGDHALVHWTAVTSTVRTIGGFDTFVMRDGKIAAQAGGAEIVLLD
jgi:uncharacterized protein (TIGR02246 family)